MRENRRDKLGGFAGIADKSAPAPLPYQISSISLVDCFWNAFLELFLCHAKRADKGKNQIEKLYINRTVLHHLKQQNVVGCTKHDVFVAWKVASEPQAELGVGKNRLDCL